MDKTIGIVGLGRVGLPAAQAYLQAGYEVIGYDLRSKANSDLVSAGGTVAADPGEVIELADTVLVMVLNDWQVDSVVNGENGLLNHSRSGKTIICMSTINRNSLEEVAALCATKGVDFVDCPFTGGPGRIPTHSLTLIAAASGSVISKVTPILGVLGNIVHAGERPGMGQAVKHCNQLLVGATHAATMEVIALARRLGLDPSTVARVVGSGIAGSDYFRLLSESVLENRPSPGGLGQMCKDVSIVATTVKNAGLPGYVAAGTAKYFAMAEQLDMHDLEGADLIQVVDTTVPDDDD